MSGSSGTTAPEGRTTRRWGPFRDGSADSVRARNESAWLIPAGQERTNHRLRADMRRFEDHDVVDAVIVGCGAGGATMAQRLTRAGWRVVALDAGPFWDPDRDWVSDEAGSHHLYWTEPRVIDGADPVPLGSNNSGRGVGGSMIHYAGYVPRFHPSDFRTASQDGVGADWPIGYADLKPYYEAIEGELPVAGEDWPWGDPHRYPHTAHPVGGNGEVFQRGADRIGLLTKVGPVAIANGRFGHRQHCIYRGFCLQGCKVNAKASPLITHVPDALAHGAEVRADCMVTRVEVDQRTGRATGVTYLRDGVEHHQRAAHVIVAGYSIETPRLLLHSASKRFPEGLCNDFDQVGRYLMVQGAPQTAGRFDAEIRMYKAPPPEVSTEEFYETDPSKPYQRGFSIQTVSPLPITWAEHVAGQGHWGASLRRYMRDYVHWSCLGALCEFLPKADNRVTLADETDRHGMPVARFSYSKCDNDNALVQAAREVMEQVLRAAGADEVITFERYAHLVGGARMAADERHGVVDSDCRAFAVPNLLITDGSVLPTQGSANPALTIMSVAARAAARLAERRSTLEAPCP
ncbi:MAG: GMC family oxidoreductase [Nocardioidaceae bacterium]